MTLATILFSLAAILFSLPTILFSLPTILMELTMSEAAHGSSCRKLLMVHHVWDLTLLGALLICLLNLQSYM